MHIPVLREKAVELWASLDKHRTIKPGIYIDATFGLGGHSRYLLKHAERESDVIIIGIERDKSQYRNSNIKLQREIKNGRLYLCNDNFTNIPKILSTFQNEYKLGLSVRGVLFDLGICTNHLKSGRGFSFQEKDDPLDMRFNPEKIILTAADILNNRREDELEKIFSEYGEERYSRRVAREIIRSRQRGKRYSGVGDLLETLEKTLAPMYRKQRIHYATRVFQALRISVNDEFGNIKQGLAKALETLDRSGRIVAISFHSGEDRIVKNFFRRESKECICEPNLPRCVCRHQKSLRIITRKPLTPDPEEIQRNSNARSAKLRAAEKVV